jgi:hypothetical protein
LTLLQQVMPQIPGAIFNSRDTLLFQTAKLQDMVAEMLEGQARPTGSVNCIINSQLGAAQQLAQQPAQQLNSSGILAAQGQQSAAQQTTATGPAVGTPQASPSIISTGIC